MLTNGGKCAIAPDHEIGGNLGWLTRSMISKGYVQNAIYFFVRAELAVKH